MGDDNDNVPIMVALMAVAEGLSELGPEELPGLYSVVMQAPTARAPLHVEAQIATVGSGSAHLAALGEWAVALGGTLVAGRLPGGRCPWYAAAAATVGGVPFEVWTILYAVPATDGEEPPTGSLKASPELFAELERRVAAGSG